MPPHELLTAESPLVSAANETARKHYLRFLEIIDIGANAAVYVWVPELPSLQESSPAVSTFARHSVGSAVRPTEIDALPEPVAVHGVGTTTARFAAPPPIDWEF